MISADDKLLDWAGLRVTDQTGNKDMPVSGTVISYCGLDNRSVTAGGNLPAHVSLCNSPPVWNVPPVGNGSCL